MSSKVFEPVLLPLAEKERLCRDLLDEFRIPLLGFSRGRSEMIIPCTISAKHKNQDREPTGALNFEKLVYKCLGCGASGGLLWFMAWHRGEDTAQVKEWLGKETGTDGHLMTLTALLKYLDAVNLHQSRRAEIAVYPAQMLEPWALIHPWVTDLPEYDDQGRNVGGWGIPEQTVLDRQVGYAQDYFMGKDQPLSERIVIPHFWKGDLVGWQTRRITDDGTPKYKSTPDFPKDETIYDYAPTEHEVAVVVEAPKSSLRHRHHIHMPATFGANITDTQARLLGRYRKVVFWLDNDDAGWKNYYDHVDFRGRVTEPSLLQRVAQMTSVWVVQNPYAADPAEIDDETAERLVAEAVPWVIWAMPKRLLCHRCDQWAHEGGC